MCFISRLYARTSYGQHGTEAVNRQSRIVKFYKTPFSAFAVFVDVDWFIESQMKNQQYPVIVGHELINSAAANDVHCVYVWNWKSKQQFHLAITNKGKERKAAAQQIEIRFDCTFHLRQFRFGNRLCWSNCLCWVNCIYSQAKRCFHASSALTKKALEKRYTFEVLNRCLDLRMRCLLVFHWKYAKWVVNDSPRIHHESCLMR